MKHFAKIPKKIRHDSTVASSQHNSHDSCVSYFGVNTFKGFCPPSGQEQLIKKTWSVNSCISISRFESWKLISYRFTKNLVFLLQPNDLTFKSSRCTQHFLDIKNQQLVRLHQTLSNNYFHSPLFVWWFR